MRSNHGLGSRLRALTLSTSMLAGLVLPAQAPAFAADPGTISGTVTDAGTGAPIAEVCVHLWRQDADGGSLPSVRTADDGTWVMGPLEPGYYATSFSDCGGRQDAYVFESYGEDEWGQPAAVELGSDAVAGIDVAMSLAADGATGSVPGISGTVTVAEGYTGRVCVTATGTSFGDQGRASLHAGQDTVALGYTISLSDGEYLVEVSDCDSAVYRGVYSATAPNGSTNDIAAATPVTVDGRAITDVDLTMIEGVPVTGTVSGDDGAPVADACVDIIPDAYRSGWYGDGEAGPEGGFALVGLAGPSRLEVRDCASSAHVSSSSGITLPADGPIDVVLERGAKVSGNVTREDGSAVDLVCASLRGVDNGAYAHSWWTEAGVYSVGAVPVGTYDLEVEHCRSFSRLAPSDTEIVIADTDGDGGADDVVRDVVLTEGGALRYDLRPTLPCFSLVDASGAYSWVRQSLVHTGEMVTSGIAPGTYDVTLSDCSWQGASDVWTGVEVVAGQVLDLDTMTSEPTGPSAGTVTGRLVNEADGTPLANVPVQMCHDEQGYCRYVNTGDDGSFTLVDLPVGPYTLRVHLPSEAEPRTQTVAVDGDLDLGDLAYAQPTGSVIGTVSDPDANPVAGARMSLCGEAGCWSDLTDETGTYAFANVPDGALRLHAWSSGELEPYSAPVTVTDGGETVADVQLVAPKPAPVGFAVNDSDEGTVPRAVVNQPTVLAVPDTCTDVTFQVFQNGEAVTFDQDGLHVTEGTAIQNEDGTWAAEFTLLQPGAAEVRIDGGADCQVEFSIYIDPSGFVRDEDGDPLVGATVTLVRSDIEAGPYELVRDGSNVMSAANRANPDTTDATGHFGWDVTAGWYKVRAEMEGCVDPVDGDAVVESRAMRIPPPVTDLDLRLDCTPPTSGGTGGGGATTPPPSHGAPSEADPLHVAVTVPNGGTATVEMVEGEAEVASDGVIRLGRSVDITAPAATAQDPLVLTFTLDRSMLWDGVQTDALGVERNGVAVADCDPDGEGATPDPCVKSRRRVGDDLEIVVLTSKASTWSFLADAAACARAEHGRFSDVDSDGVHARSIGCIATLAIARGKADGSFGPGDEVTRGQMASFLHRALDALGVDLPQGGDRFADDDGTTHEGAINALAELGIIRGTSATEFDPEGIVSRAQTAALIVRAVEHATGSRLEAGRDRFGDDDGTTHEAAIDRAAAAGLVLGVSADRFDPAAAVTRQQMASFLVRLLDHAVAHQLMS